MLYVHLILVFANGLLPSGFLVNILYAFPVPPLLAILSIHTVIGSRDSIVGIATGYGLHDQDVEVGVSLKSRIFFHVVQAGFWVHPASY
jgi:hypothetical protein